jgi:hypothetical protein
MRYSALIKISMVALGFSACAPKITTEFRGAGEAAVTAHDAHPSRTPQRSQLFTMKIDFRKNHFSGLLLVKQTGDGHYRMVFNTHFGMGVFDVEVSRDTFQVHSCLEALNRKRILRLFEQDLRIFYRNNFPDVMTIKHRGIGLQIALERVDNTATL